MADGSNSNEVEDTEANYFAMCLLMPAEVVKKEVRAMGGVDLANDDNLRALARRFGVSMTAMAMRIAQLKWGVR